ncbi:MAG: hypothetical protein AAF297_10120 [Planctomycetota bacterium]
MQRHNTRPAFSGMTLVGLLVVLAIGLAIYFAAGPSGKSYAESVRDTRDRGRDMAQQQDDNQLATLVFQYQLENDDRIPAGPEVLGIEWMPGAKDDLGTLVRYEARTEGRGTVLDIISAGPDTEHDTDDDEVLRTITLPAGGGGLGGAGIPGLPDGIVGP